MSKLASVRLGVHHSCNIHETTRHGHGTVRGGGGVYDDRGGRERYDGMNCRMRGGYFTSF
jgi:hypothetical protein